MKYQIYKKCSISNGDGIKELDIPLDRAYNGRTIRYNNEDWKVINVTDNCSVFLGER